MVLNLGLWSAGKILTLMMHDLKMFGKHCCNLTMREKNLFSSNIRARKIKRSTNTTDTLCSTLFVCIEPFFWRGCKAKLWTSIKSTNQKNGRHVPVCVKPSMGWAKTLTNTSTSNSKVTLRNLYKIACWPSGFFDLCVLYFLYL
jgi:hypothetical protein